MVVRFGKREPDRRGLLDSMDQVAAERPLENGKNEKQKTILERKELQLFKFWIVFRMHDVLILYAWYFWIHFSHFHFFTDNLKLQTLKNNNHTVWKFAFAFLGSANRLKQICSIIYITHIPVIEL